MKQRAKRTQGARGTAGLFDDAPWSHGGWRPGAGRKRKPGSESHDVRPALPRGKPVHVTMRLREGLSGLRRSENLRVLERCFRAGKERFGMRLVHYSVQSNHVHLIVEAVDRRALMRGMRGLTIRCARQLNKAWGTRGPVFGARYTARILHALADVRNTLAYVLLNAKRHGSRYAITAKRFWDPCSSGAWFHGWEYPIPASARRGERPVAEPRSWALLSGWLRHYDRLCPTEVPGPAP